MLGFEQAASLEAEPSATSNSCNVCKSGHASPYIAMSLRWKVQTFKFSGIRNKINILNSLILFLFQNIVMLLFFQFVWTASDLYLGSGRMWLDIEGSKVWLHL